MTTNGSGKPTPSTNGTKLGNRADETEELLSAVQALIKPFIQSADTDTPQKVHGIDPRPNGSKPALSSSLPPQDLKQLLPSSLPQDGVGKDDFLSIVQTILTNSTNTWDTGFLDKLYSTPTPIGLASDLLLSTLNTNLHVYQVSPALTLIEKLTCRSLATLFGFIGPYAGGVSQPGGSAANATSMVTARNILFPETKTEGSGGRKFVLFTSEHGHYSVEKAAQMFGFGSRAVKSVAVDSSGRMDPKALSSAIATSRQAGETPFYVNATAGTTVLGSFDPLDAIADVCQKEGLWLHVDGSWGGSVIFSEAQRHKLQGSSRADSICICAHKMLQVPLTCSFLLVSDMRRLHQGMTLPAGYLFHSADPPEEMTNGHHHAEKEEREWDGIPGSLDQFYDLADLTPQCGRRGDSLKLALTWLYHGSSGFSAAIDHAFSIATHLTSLIASNPKFSLVSSDPPACLQVCFYYAKTSDAGRNSAVTEGITKVLREEGGFMTDFAPGEHGKFFRVVVNGGTDRGTVEGLVKGIERAGERMGL